jgi:hypothetical protein
MLGDILLQIPSVYLLRNSMRAIRDHSPYKCEPTRKAVHAKAMDLITLLNDFWGRYGIIVDPGYDYS